MARIRFTGSGNVFLLVFIIFTCVGSNAEKKKPRCELITIPMCKDIAYNQTSMPNQLNHEKQDEAGLEVHQFWPLVEIKCSPDLEFFLCSVYTPICIEDYDKPLLACRSVCQRAKSGCAPIMKQYGFDWPSALECSKFPNYGDPDQLCMDHHKNSTDGRRKPSDICKCSCHGALVNTDHSYRQYGPYKNESFSVGGIPNCALPCNGIHLSDEEKGFTEIWIAVTAILCCISTATTLTTFLIDMERFKYPERPIIFLSGCYFMVSIGYIIRLIVGHNAVACDGSMIIYNYHLVRYNSYGSGLCTTVFLLIYFFGMASSIWWVILAFTWFLAAGLKWGNEAITSYSPWFHLAAWLTPTLQTISVLVMAGVDGDPVSGICYVGNQNMSNQRIFVIVPLIIYLVLGSCFLLAGFVSLFRIRSVIKQQGSSKTEKLEKLMIRIGVFSVLYTVPATTVISCYFYEQLFHAQWETALVCPCNENRGEKPNYQALMLRYFTTLLVGITSGFWIWSGKTLDSWRRLSSRICGRRGHTYDYPTQPIKQPIAPSCNSYQPAPSIHAVSMSTTSHMGSMCKTLPLTHV